MPGMASYRLTYARTAKRDLNARCQLGEVIQSRRMSRRSPSLMRMIRSGPKFSLSRPNLVS